MNVMVKLDGTARVLAKRKEIELSVTPNTTWRDIVIALAKAVPALVGDVITKDKRDLIGALNRSGKLSIQDLDAPAELSANDFLMIVEDAC